jgi:hypothetical protein
MFVLVAVLRWLRVNQGDGWPSLPADRPEVKWSDQMPLRGAELQAVDVGDARMALEVLSS